ncbi:unnamed protein product [Cyprideis torosa]|uniref:Uncharacterized protein n=1 Tax=Cyprideis torosa TaxID=163714 RepID=A0A7R8WB67_9CRUS|nr:unnamed protein product [Cyprideis torosa]CAG0890487.1 unnamed protein product [Cyprideis torosa]
MAGTKMDIWEPSIEAPCTKPEISVKEEADETETTEHQPNRRMKRGSPKTNKATIHYDYHSVRGDRFEQRWDLKRHERYHTGDTGRRPHSWGWSSKGFTRLGNHAGEKLFKCAYCDERFTQSAHRKDHQNVHFKKKPHKCMYCDRRFTSGSDRNMHQRIHFGEKPYQCLLCPASFITAVALRVHLKSHKGERPFRCEVPMRLVWGKVHLVNQAGNLKKHVLIHTGEKPYECRVCDKGFTTGSELRRHARTHTGFGRSSHLKDHARTHTKERPCECIVCGKRFSRADTLQTHVRIHSGEKAHHCQLCSASFIKPGSLRVHLRTHTGERPFQCDLCGKKYTQSNNLRYHEKRAHAETHSGL